MALFVVMLTATFGTGVVLLLDHMPWFKRRPVVARLQPYSRGGTAKSGSTRSEVPLREVLEPLISQWGARTSRLFGIDTDLETRIDRADANLDPYSFRLRQLTWSVIALGISGIIALQFRPPPVATAMMVLGTPLLAILGFEQHLNSRAAHRQQQLQDELPVLIEQLGMLLSSGYSLGAAVARIADRGSGVASSDLTLVAVWIRQGMSETAAFERWADLSGLDSVRRLVRVLALHTEAGDLGPLISDEARSVRAEAHRNLLEKIERRAQLVWVPVTVATLVPGLLFLAVPFYAAMAQVTGS